MLPAPTPFRKCNWWEIRRKSTRGILGSACERVERTWTKDASGGRGQTCRWKNTMFPNYYWQCLNYFALRRRPRINRSLQRGQPRSGQKSVSVSVAISVSLLEDSLIYLCEMHVQRFTRLEVRNCVSQWRFELFNDSLPFNVATWYRRSLPEKANPGSTYFIFMST